MQHWQAVRYAVGLGPRDLVRRIAVNTFLFVIFTYGVLNIILRLADGHQICHTGCPLKAKFLSLKTANGK